MDFVQHSIDWAKGEIFEATLIAAFGLLTILAGVLFWKLGKSPNAKAVVNVEPNKGTERWRTLPETASPGEAPARIFSVIAWLRNELAANAEIVVKATNTRARLNNNDATNRFRCDQRTSRK